MTELERVLEVQVLDSAIDQIPHRRERLPERATLAAAKATLRTTQQRIADATARSEVASARIEVLEAAGAKRATKKARLEQQLKTVIAPREAEALMGEIANLDRERSESDDEELESMDGLETAMAELEAAEAEAVTQQAAVDAASAEAAAAEAALEAERADLVERRTAAAAAIAPATLTKYEQLRASYGGVAISRIHAGRCGACHLDQSRAGLDALNSAPDDALIECEQCGRLLVR